MEKLSRFSGGGAVAFRQCRTGSPRPPPALWLPLLLLALFSAFLPGWPALTVQANAPPPPSYVYGEIVNAPPEAAFIDILIPLDPSDERYVEFQEQRLGNVTADSPIVQYAEGGYRSLFFHCRGVDAENCTLPDCFFTLESSSLSLDDLAPSLKVALLDGEGNILKVSPAASLLPAEENTFPRTLRYDAAADTLEITFAPVYTGSSSDVPLTVPLILCILARMALSIAVETLLALPFRLRPLWKIAVVNLITQILLVALMFSGSAVYYAALFMGEIVVYLAEFVAYLSLFHGVSRRKIAVYTLLANTVTLLLSLAMNAAGVLVG